MKRNIRLERLLPYPPERVWYALTEQQTLASWFMPNDLVPRLNYSFTFHMKPQRGWDGITHCEVIELEALCRLAFSYRGEASGEKPLACAGINSRVADSAAKGIFTRLDTVLRFTLTPERGADGKESTRLILEHTGFQGFKLVIVSLIMGFGWRKLLRRLDATLHELASEQPLTGTSLPTRQ